MSPLELYVLGWRESAASLAALLPTLNESDWSTPTDCPGWSVRDIAAHLAHLEHELASDDTSAAPSGSQLSSSFTEAGVAARRGRSTSELITEFTDAVAIRIEALTVLPEDPSVPAPLTPGGVDWTWETLLRNRAIDLWVHEQDIRRAIGRPGGLDSTGARITIESFRSAMPYVVGRKVRPGAGASVGWHVTGALAFDLTVAVGDDGRATPSDRPPGTLLTMNGEDFAILGAGRRAPDRLDVEIIGDEELARKVLSAMPVTF